MSSPSEEPQLSKVFFLKPSAIPRALVIQKKDHLKISEDGGKSWGIIPMSLVQGTIPIREKRIE